MTFMEEIVRATIKVREFDLAKDQISIMSDKVLAGQLEMEVFTAQLWICSSPAIVEARISTASPNVKDVMREVYLKFTEMFGGRRYYEQVY